VVDWLVRLGHLVLARVHHTQTYTLAFI